MTQLITLLHHTYAESRWCICSPDHNCFVRQKPLLKYLETEADVCLAGQTSFSTNADSYAYKPWGWASIAYPDQVHSNGDVTIEAVASRSSYDTFLQALITVYILYTQTDWAGYIRFALPELPPPFFFTLYLALFR